MKQIGMAGMMAVMLLVSVPGVAMAQALVDDEYAPFMRFEGADGYQGSQEVPHSEKDSPSNTFESDDNTRTFESDDNTRTFESDDNTRSGFFEVQSFLKADSLVGLLKDIIKVIRIFATPVIVFFIIYGGFLLATAGARPDNISKGKSTILWALIGGVIIIGAELILGVLESTINDITR